jgi:trehalose 6-phosphate synthase complex regulatory subunit
VFIQVALLGPGAEEDELLSDVNEIVTRTNSKYGSIVHHPMIFKHADLDFLDYLGMLCAADALVITSLREGWNLTSHEYVICQEKDHHGLILSEFIGSASAFADAALLVNPWDIKGMADAIYKVLTMSPEETNQRWEKAFDHVKTHDATNWVTGFLTSLKNAYIEQQRGVATVLPKLNVDTYTGKYSLAEKRLFVVDYEGYLIVNYTDCRHVSCLG